MPIFEYECPVCGKHIERLDKDASSWMPCECGEWMGKVMSAPSFRINGANEANGYTIRKGNNDK